MFYVKQKTRREGRVWNCWFISECFWLSYCADRSHQSRLHICLSGGQPFLRLCLVKPIDFINIPAIDSQLALFFNVNFNEFKQHTNNLPRLF